MISPEPAEILMSDSKTTMPVFRRSSRCESVNCVEVATPVTAPSCATRPMPDQRLTFDADAWRGFIAGVAAGEFDLPLNVSV